MYFKTKGSQKPKSRRMDVAYRKWIYTSWMWATPLLLGLSVSAGLAPPNCLAPCNQPALPAYTR